MKGIIFTDWEGINLAPLSKGCSEPLFPICDKPIIDYLLKRLKIAGVNEVMVVLNSRMEDLACYLGNGEKFGVDIDYLCQNIPLGRGGAIREAANFLDNEPFFLVDSSLIIDFDLRNLIDFHRKRRSCLTFGFKGDIPSGLESPWDGGIKPFSLPLTGFRSCGIYIADSKILDFIEGSGYLDMEGQLIPSLINKGVPVLPYKISGYIKDIELLDDYFKANMDLLEGRINGIYSPKVYRREIMDSVWAGKDVEISPDVKLTGPIVIGDNVRIERNCQIIGPTVIGKDCHVMDEAFIEKSIILAGSYVGKMSRVESSILGEGYHLENGKVSRKMAVTGHLTLGDANLMQLNFREIEAVLDESRFSIKIRRNIYLTVKRAFDIIISFFALFLGSPIFLMISLAIKADSNGPIFFWQNRCTKGGRRFRMYKFRSMATGSEKQQNNLRHKNDLDGPIFKMINDPRRTRVGSFLRSTSLDELPQFLNVLKGDMSLVGPRPLVMEEMGNFPAWRMARLRVKAGITGMWQISGRSDTSFHDWIKNDIYYVKNQSLWLDLMILLKTIRIVLARLGAR